MRRTFAATVAVGAVVVGLTLAARPAGASLIWDGDAARGSASAMFGIDNCDSPGSISTVNDPARGPVWRFDKPAGSNRCEGHGFKTGGSMYHFTNNATYYLGWSSRLSSTVDNNAVFQWKSYGNHLQNYPVVLKLIGGKLTMLNRQPGGNDYRPWSSPVSANAWNHVVLGIHTSDALTGGWVELWFNGAQQTFSNGSTRWPCRTWDSSNDPKWGVYGAENSSVTNDVDDLKVGTAAADVGASAPRAPASPRPSSAPPSSAKPSPPPSAATSPAEAAPTGTEDSADPVPAAPPATELASGSAGSAATVAWIGAAVLAAAAAVAVTLWIRHRRAPAPRHAGGATRSDRPQGTPPGTPP
jgi:hypothetical protein